MTNQAYIGQLESRVKEEESTSIVQRTRLAEIEAENKELRARLESLSSLIGIYASGSQ